MMHVVSPRCSPKTRAQLDVLAPRIANNEPSIFGLSGHFMAPIVVARISLGGVHLSVD
jgi:hypothetical protein